MLGALKAISSYFDFIKDVFFVDQVILSIGGFYIVFYFYRSFSCVVSNTYCLSLKTGVYQYSVYFPGRSLFDFFDYHSNDNSWSKIIISSS